MKSYIFACLLAAFAPAFILLTLGGIVVYDTEGSSEAQLVDLMTGALILYGYLSAALALTYGIMLRLGKIKGTWWLNLGLFLTVLILLPLLFLGVSLNGVDISSAVEGGAFRVGHHLFYTLALVTVVFVSGFSIKREYVK